MSARQTIRLLSPKSPLALSRLLRLSRLGSLVESRKSTVNRPYLDKLHELLLASTYELHMHSKSLQNVLVDQHANDLWNEINRVTIMCDLAEVLRGGATESTEVPRLLKILGRDRNTTVAHVLLNRIRSANGISHTGNDLPTFKRTPRLSLEVTMWFTCAKGHPVFKHQLKKGVCEDCVLAEQEKVRSEASAAVGQPGDHRQNVPIHRGDGGQQGQRGRGRGRGRRGRGRRGGRRGGHQRNYGPFYS